jgi:hypothetical protein
MTTGPTEVPGRAVVAVTACLTVLVVLTVVALV